MFQVYLTISGGFAKRTPCHKPPGHFALYTPTVFFEISFYLQWKTRPFLFWSLWIYTHVELSRSKPSTTNYTVQVSYLKDNIQQYEPISCNFTIEKNVADIAYISYFQHLHFFHYIFLHPAINGSDKTIDKTACHNLEGLSFSARSENVLISWAQAAQTCKSLGGHLPTIRSKSDLINMLKFYFSPCTVFTEALYIGLHLSEGVC